jgi:hypothetical protein
MTARLLPQRDPRHLPEFTLWHMTKDDQVSEARARILPIDALLDLRVYRSNYDGTLGLHWLQTRSAAAVDALALHATWVLDCHTSGRRVLPGV